MYTNVYLFLSFFGAQTGRKTGVTIWRCRQVSEQVAVGQLWWQLNSLTRTKTATEMEIETKWRNRTHRGSLPNPPAVDNKKQWQRILRKPDRCEIQSGIYKKYGTSFSNKYWIHFYWKMFAKLSASWFKL